MQVHFRDGPFDFLGGLGFLLKNILVLISLKKIFWFRVTEKNNIFCQQAKKIICVSVKNM